MQISRSTERITSFRWNELLNWVRKQHLLNFLARITRPVSLPTLHTLLLRHWYAGNWRSLSCFAQSRYSQPVRKSSDISFYRPPSYFVLAIIPSLSRIMPRADNVGGVGRMRRCGWTAAAVAETSRNMISGPMRLSHAVVVRESTRHCEEKSRRAQEIILHRRVMHCARLLAIIAVSYYSFATKLETLNEAVVYPTPITQNRCALVLFTFLFSALIDCVHVYKLVSDFLRGWCFCYIAAQDDYRICRRAMLIYSSLFTARVERNNDTVNRQRRKTT